MKCYAHAIDIWSIIMPMPQTSKYDAYKMDIF